MTGCFSTAYLPPIGWFKAALKCDEILLEKHESWQKQSYRSRCYILGPNGSQMLNVPILHNEQKEKMGTVEISYRENWQHTHWQAIKTAYGSAPFFESLAPELEAFYTKKYQRLFDWNLHLLHLMLDWLQVDLPLNFTSEWKPQRENDYREVFHPKRPRSGNFSRYPQVFDDEMDFVPNLSIIDLIFNEGRAAYDYLLFEDWDV